MVTYKIAVAGTGYVGLVAGVCFAHVGHQVVCVDIDEAKVKMMKRGISPIYEDGLEDLMHENYTEGRLDYTTDYRCAYRDADVIFIGVGTPELPDGSANLGYVANVAKQIAQSVEHDCLVVIKSTVPVGTNDKIEHYIHDMLDKPVHVEVASNPEFLAQGTAVHDTLHAARIIIGTESENAQRILTEIYEPYNIPIVSVRRRSAEMIKYACNDFLALKISYMNDIANLCQIVGADVTDVARGMSYDARIGAKFLNAGIGYGGSCFPKDTKALCHIARENGYVLRTVEAAVNINKDQKEKLFHMAKKRVLSYSGMKVGVLGLTFKQGTDDLREAASIDNIKLLLECGADVFAYDPAGMECYKKLFPEGKSGNGRITYVTSAIHAITDAGVCFVFTEWNEFREISADTFKSLMRTPLVYDGRNLFDPQMMLKAGVEYHSIGR